MDSIQEHETLWNFECALSDEIAKSEVSFRKALFTVTAAKCLLNIVWPIVITIVLSAIGWLLATTQWVAYIPHWLAWTGLAIIAIDFASMLYNDKPREAWDIDIIICFFSVAVLTKTPFLPAILILPTVIFMTVDCCRHIRNDFKQHHADMISNFRRTIRSSSRWNKLADIVAREIYWKVGEPLANLKKVTIKDNVDEWFKNEEIRLSKLSNSLNRVPDYFRMQAEKMQYHEVAHTEFSPDAYQIKEETATAYGEFREVINQLHVDMIYRVDDKMLFAMLERINKLIRPTPPANTNPQ